MTDSVKHVIVLVLENRSFDHMLGYLTPDYPAGSFEGISGHETNLDAAGTPVRVSSAGSPVLPTSPDHSHTGVIFQLTGTHDATAPLTNGGFVQSYAAITGGDGHEAMRCLAPAKVPVLATLARAFAVCDHWFCSVPGETWPNRNYLHAATSDGEVDIDMRAYWRRTIFDTLEEAGHDWRVYHRGPAQVWALPTVWQAPFNRRRRFRRLDTLAADIRSGDLPAYTFVEPDHGLLWPKERSNSQHPSSNDQNGRDFYAGEQLILEIYRALTETPDVWKGALFLVTYDEHGGFFDHAAPPRGVAPAVPPDPNPAGFAFDLLGPRVPAVLMSPWIPAATVDNTVYDHSAVPASLRERFAPAKPHLTLRDAASGTIWHNLSLTAPRHAADMPDPDALQALLHQVAQGTTGHRAAVRVETGEPEPGLDSFQRDLLTLAVRVDAAVSTTPPDQPVPSERIDAALRGRAMDRGLTKTAGVSAIEAAGAPGLINAYARAAYLEGMERRFRQE